MFFTYKAVENQRLFHTNANWNCFTVKPFFISIGFSTKLYQVVKANK